MIDISILDVFPVLLKGVSVTIQVLVLSAIFSYLIAFIAGFGRLSKNVLVRKFTGFYIEIFRGTSLIVQLFWFYYAIPMLFNVQVGSELMAGVLAISLNYGAYMSEIVRGSIIAVDKGQREAATALNMTRFQQMRLVILPQAVRMMLPEFGNYLIQILKATSLVSLIGMTDILYHGNMLRSTNIAMAPTIYLLILVFYFILALPLIFLTRKAEDISKKGVASS
ncbi:polar amino acid transport system permease protein [Cerasibacillus quisquiliarum]|uniref:Ectoine/hydroxyectoine ABC transporter permease subunit EhuC n=1 Tax=Cerasibacillus quisquiliarum TaxID=227865 RepID=A0A511V2H3_9BACI|nr:ectoine/hydroxyectoine ABC transporter permease subunit EhuC [Cerasibacillus quisquiliarum]MBB5147246.1 polar amino acid transport system permease protein [Cerasibacillus quisquiliarum]GEN32251.1 ectoine/hydroxyectoine ABC transporter permease subunit EhuC [Cerasibacillus quisquiliarum]